MISFKILNEENYKKIAEELSDGLSPEEREELFSIAESFISSEEEDIEFALSLFGACALIRVFDMGRYFFMFPYELSADAHVASAIREIGKYTMREEIPFVLSDVPADRLSELSGFRHFDIDAEDESGTVYRVKFKNECALTHEIPELVVGRVTLCELSDADISEHARLAKDENVNKYWGYDYSDDVPNPSDEYFIDKAREEFDRGVAISFAVRAEGKFIGEALIYAFDFLGGAEFAVRLLPEYWGQGYGKESVRAIISAASEIGLVTLRAYAMKDNIPSVKMLRGVMEEISSDADRFLYSIDLNN